MSIASSAQCRSSKTRTVGRASATSSRKRRHAANCSSRPAVGPDSTPSSGSSRSRSHEPFVGFGQRPLELLDRRCGSVRVEDPGVGLEDLAERPERDPGPVRQTSSLPPRDEDRLRVDVCQAARATRRLLPRPGSPTTVANRIERSETAASNRLVKRRSSSDRPTNGVALVRDRSIPSRARGAIGWNTRTGSALPLSVAGGSSS